MVIGNWGEVIGWRIWGDLEVFWEIFLLTETGLCINWAYEGGAGNRDYSIEKMFLVLNEREMRWQ